MEAREVTLPLGIVVERRQSIHAWGDDTWTPVAVITGASLDTVWTHMVSGEGWSRFLASTLLLELHHTETDAYVFNLMSKTPYLYVVLRTDAEAEEGRPVTAYMVTASPYEAEGHLESDEEIVEKVPMPGEVQLWVTAFVDRHHVDEPFVKRKRNKIRDEEHLFGKEPVFANRRNGPSKVPH